MSTASTPEVAGLGIALVKQELECGVCLDIYERPVTLAWYTPPHKHEEGLIEDEFPDHHTLWGNVPVQWPQSV